MEKTVWGAKGLEEQIAKQTTAQTKLTMLQKLKEKAEAPKGAAVENLQSLWGSLEPKK